MKSYGIEAKDKDTLFKIYNYVLSDHPEPFFGRMAVKSPIQKVHRPLKSMPVRHSQMRKSEHMRNS